ncbi:MAG: hypothetical protein ACE5JI_04570 [Acidobacteriota bacterium]
MGEDVKAELEKFRRKLEGEKEPEETAAAKEEAAREPPKREDDEVARREEIADLLNRAADLVDEATGKTTDDLDPGGFIKRTAQGGKRCLNDAAFFITHPGDVPSRGKRE